MKKIQYFVIFLFAFTYLNGCDGNRSYPGEADENRIIVGAERTGVYLPLLDNMNVAVIANQTSQILSVHLVDSLVNAGINIIKVFSPEHGFRGEAEAGKSLDSYIDEITGINVISLYGKNNKPKNSDLWDVDVVIFDIQDVGARFYTYISTMTYAMEACAENGIQFIILDRPNPNGFYVDGPVLKEQYASFVGLHPVPIVHGMTVAEYAKMVNGEGWLENGMKCDLKIVTCLNYDHKKLYNLPVKPSPNLPDMTSVYLYPSLCLFEGTVISIGRGTDKPFKIIGHPDLKDKSFSFIPVSIPGVSANPKFEGQKCFGYDLSGFNIESEKDSMKINLLWMISIYEEFENKNEFFNSYFNKLAGNNILQEQIKNGKTIKEIRASWKDDLNIFNNIRKKYLLYNDY